MRYIVKISLDTVHRTNNKQEALNVVSSLFRKGHDDVYLYGGPLGSWRD